MRLTVSYAFIVALGLVYASASASDHWRKEGIGLVTRVAILNFSQHIVVSSAKGVVARLDLRTGDSVWRAPPIYDSEKIEALVVYENGSFPFAFTIFEKDGKNGVPEKVIRAFSLSNGTALWDTPGCSVGTLHGTSVDYASIVAVRRCEVSEDSDKTVAFLNLATGLDVSDKESITPLRKETSQEPGINGNSENASNNAAEDEKADGEKATIAEKWDLGKMSSSVKWFTEKAGSGEIQQRDGSTKWTIDATVYEEVVSGKESGPTPDLLSKTDGKFMLKVPGRFGREIWTRREGLAHSKVGVFCSSSYEEGSKPDILVTLTDLGTLFGLDTEKNGTVIWETEIDLHAEALKKDRCRLITGHANFVAALCAHDLPDSHATSLAIIDGPSGDVSLFQTFPNFRASHASFLGNCCRQEHSCVHLVDSSGKSQIASTCDDEYIHNIDWTGLTPAYVTAAAGADKVEGIRDGKVDWLVKLPDYLKVKLLAIEKPPHPSALRFRKAAVRVTGDRRLLYKVTDPSVSLVLGADESSTKLAAVVIDGASGSIIDTVHHENATEPFSAVRSDNWFIYSFWNTYLLQQELHVIDMYEGKARPNFLKAYAKKPINQLLIFGQKIKQVFISGKTEQPKNFCSAGSSETAKSDQCKEFTINPSTHSVRLPPKVATLRSSFVLSHRVKSLEVTETEGTITERSVLLGLSSGQVVALSRLAVDARRPMTNVEPDSTELLQPYFPYLSFLSSQSAGAYVTKNEYVFGLEGLAVAPTPKQESNCQIAAIGIDVFYRKFAPAGSYDTLPDDFRYSIVLATLIILALSVWYSEKIRRASLLEASW